MHGGVVEGVAAVDVDAGDGDSTGTSRRAGVGDVGIRGEFPVPAKDENGSGDFPKLDDCREIEFVVKDVLQGGAELVGRGILIFTVGEIAGDGMLSQVALDFLGMDAENLSGEPRKGIAA